MGGEGSGRYPKGSGQDKSLAGIGKHGGDDSTGTTKEYSFKENYKVDSRFSAFVQEMRVDREKTVKGFIDGKIKSIGEYTEGNYRIVITDNNQTLYFRNDYPNDPVPAGKWMGHVEKEWNITQSEFNKLPLKERATMEAKEQVKWIEKEYEDLYLDFYKPDVHSKFWLDNGGANLKMHKEKEYEKEIHKLFKKEVEEK
jgi:hypothetical protein